MLRTSTRSHAEGRHRMKRVFVVAILAALVAAAAVIGLANSTGRDQAGNVTRFAGDDFVPKLTATANGKAWEAGRFTNEIGEACRELRSPGGWSVSNCTLSVDTFRNGPINVSLGGTQQTAYLYGLARTDVARLELSMDNCSVRRVPLRDSLFLSVFAKAEAAPSPYKLVALDSSGSVLDTVVLGGGHAGRSTSC
jgi:hypothetical protein